MINPDPPITFEPPKKMDAHKIVHWSKALKKLEGVKEGSAIKTKALQFLKNKCVGYDGEKKEFYVKPIPGYNKTTYNIKEEKKHLACNCQFYRKVSKDWDHPICSHVLAVKMWLEITRWNQELPK